MQESTRAYLYRVALALMPILVAVGIIQEQDVPLYVALLAAVLSTGLAVANTSTHPEE